jgi:DDE superfamily endonuclease
VSKNDMKHPQILDIYSDYLLVSFSLVTATGLSELLDRGYSHDQISRFLQQGKFSQKDFWQTIKQFIRKIESSSGILIIDDVIEHKPHSTENEIICYHFDHTSGRSVKGINIVNFLYYNQLADGTEVNIPAAFEIVAKTEDYFDAKTNQVKRRSAVTKNELVRSRLRTLKEMNRLQFGYVTWDTWFSAKENFDFVHYSLKKSFVGAIKSNRLIALSEQDKQQGKFVKVSELDFSAQPVISVYLKGLDFPLLLTKQIFTNKDGSTGLLYLVSNDLDLTYNDLIAIYQKRWKVEVFHKSLKQNVALEKSPTKFEVTQSNHIFASMIAFCKLEMLKLKEKMNHFAIKNRLYIKAIKAALDEYQKMKNNNTTAVQTLLLNPA